ncbi:MAG TPA: AraC family transcriptional regulator [Rhizomicrobium sp.]|nr:AraC family transcriptional regulator [Rhizomicrobium sp.]
MIAGNKSGLTVAAGLARGLAEFSVSRGAPRGELLARAGIALADLADQDNRIPFEKYVLLMRAGKALTGDPALALHYGAANDIAEVSVVGLIANASETMFEAFQQLSRFGRLVIEFDGGPDRFRTAQEDGGLWAVDNRQNPNDFPELTESTFARMVCGPRRFGVTQIAKRICVTHPAPEYRDEYERIFEVPVTFGAKWNAMMIDERWMFHRLQPQPRYVFGVLSERADALIHDLEKSKTMRGRVEALLMPVLHKGDASMETVAGKMGMSRQTLFRRLKEEGTTFEAVLDALRHRLALDYLGGRKVSVNETAYLVGFSDPAAFSRAFKRWTGSSPKAFRQGDSVR